MDVESRKVTEISADEKGSNRFQTGSSWRNAAQTLEKIVATTWEKQQRPEHLLRSLCLLVAESSDSKAKEGFVAVELVEAVQKYRFAGDSWNGDPDTERARKLVNPTWKKLQRTWALKRTGVVERLTDHNVNLLPVLERKEGQPGGDSHRYWLKFEEADEGSNDSLPSETTVPSGGVRYYTEETNGEESHWLARTGLLLAGRTAKIVARVLMSLWILFVLIIFFNYWSIVTANSTIKAISSFFTVGLFGAMAWWMLIKSFLELASNRIALIPFWLQDSDNPDRLMELRRNEVSGTNTFILTRYSAKCVLCGSKVKVASGRREFPGRLVGRCSHSPNEHVFSFDHALRVGKPLR